MHGGICHLEDNLVFVEVDVSGDIPSRKVLQVELDVSLTCLSGKFASCPAGSPVQLLGLFAIPFVKRNSGKGKRRSRGRKQIAASLQILPRIGPLPKVVVREAASQLVFIVSGVAADRRIECAYRSLVSPLACKYFAPDSVEQRFLRFLPNCAFDGLQRGFRIIVQQMLRIVSFFVRPPPLRACR